MEEKERYECKYNEKLMKHYTFDNENKEELGYKGVVRVLNQQDARIKELEKENQKANIKNYLTDYYLVEKENQQLNEHIKELELLLKADKKIETNSLNGFEKLRQENKQLKQSQKQLAISELENLRLLIMRQTYICGGLATKNEIVEANAYNRCLADIRDILDNQIKSFKGEEKWKRMIIY